MSESKKTASHARLVGPPHWRVFEDVTHGWWGIEEDILDGNTILYPKKLNREALDGIVRFHNAATLSPPTREEGVRGND